ncbi:MerR family DNA-binding protein [Streptomyces lydicus]
MYSGDDIARIHRALVYKELGFPLAAIGRILDDPDADARGHLRRQRAQLVECISRLQKTVGSVDRMLEASKTGMRLTPEEQIEIFGDDWQSAWVEEAEEHWGDSAQWAPYAEPRPTASIRNPREGSEAGHRARRPAHPRAVLPTVKTGPTGLDDHYIPVP